MSSDKQLRPDAAAFEHLSGAQDGTQSVAQTTQSSDTTAAVKVRKRRASKPKASAVNATSDPKDANATNATSATNATTVENVAPANASGLDSANTSDDILSPVVSSTDTAPKTRKPRARKTNKTAQTTNAAVVAVTDAEAVEAMPQVLVDTNAANHANANTANANAAQVMTDSATVAPKKRRGRTRKVAATAAPSADNAGMVGGLLSQLEDAQQVSGQDTPKSNASDSIAYDFNAADSNAAKLKAAPSNSAQEDEARSLESVSVEQQTAKLKPSGRKVNLGIFSKQLGQDNWDNLSNSQQSHLAESADPISLLHSIANNYKDLPQTSAGNVQVQSDEERRLAAFNDVPLPDVAEMIPPHEEGDEGALVADFALEDDAELPDMPDYLKEEFSQAPVADPLYEPEFSPEERPYSNPAYVRPGQILRNKDRDYMRQLAREFGVEDLPIPTRRTRSLNANIQNSGGSISGGKSSGAQNSGDVTSTLAAQTNGFNVSGLEGFLPNTVAKTQKHVSYAESLENDDSAYDIPMDWEDSDEQISVQEQLQRYKQQEEQTQKALASWQNPNYLASFIERKEPEPKGEVVFTKAMAAHNMQPISLAYVQFLMKHYPLDKLEDQSAFNVVLLCLFGKMQSGHICMNLSSVVNLFYVLKEWIEPRFQQHQRETSQRLIRDPYYSPTPEPIDELYTELEEHSPKTNQYLLQLINACSAISTDASNEVPLIWDLQRLYVRRYFLYEQRIAAYIQNQRCELLLDESKVKAMIDVLFPAYQDQELPDHTNWQKVAALMSTTSNFTVISGGPGTGKTTTVFKLLLLLLNLAHSDRQILMCAPTAKAASRMGESIAQQLKSDKTAKIISELCALSGSNEELLKAKLPRQAETVHRLLKVRPHMATPIFNAQNKLNCDVLIVDEVSMLEMSLFAKLVDALPSGCKLILLGDKDQLSSVGAGMVLGDICSILNSQEPRRIEPEVLDYLSRMSGYSKEQLLCGKIANHIALLQYSWRSKDVPEIIELAKIFNEAQTINAQLSHLYAEDELQNESSGRQVMKDVIYGSERAHFSADYQSYCESLLEKVKSSCLIAHDPKVPESMPSVGNLALGDRGANKLSEAYLSSEAQDSAETKPEDEPYVVLKDGKNQFQAPLVLHLLPEPIDESKLLSANLELNDKKDRDFSTDDEGEDNRSKLMRQEECFLKRQRLLEQHRLEMERAQKDMQTTLVFLRHILVKSWVNPYGKDNYAPFLNMLKQCDFKVNPDSLQCEELFKAMDLFRVLCSNHSDWFGDRNLNSRIEDEVLKTYVNHNGRHFERGEFFPGQIVLITANDPLLNLVNGSVGFCAYLDDSGDINNQSFVQYVQRAASKLKAAAGKNASSESAQDKLGQLVQISQMGHTSQIGLKASSNGNSNSLEAKGAGLDFGKLNSNLSSNANQNLKVFIPMGVKDGKLQVNVISTLLLNHYESGFAMSIHKSQGSEYNHVAIVLNQRVNPILTKELVYTGITRAKKRVEIVASESSLQYALSHAVLRESGLEKRLYPDFDLSGAIKVSAV